MLKSAVENYKKMQLYSLDSVPVKASIIAELKQDLNQYGKQVLDRNQIINLIAKLIVYIEFGFSYREYRKLFLQILNLCGWNWEQLFEYVDKDAQYVRLSKEKLRKIIIWQKSGSQRQKNKGEVVDQMFAIMKERKDGHYFFQNEVCEYEIKIDESLIILRNIRKQIEYYII